MKSIATTYDGIKFRSRLEARYAMLFNSLNIKWYYEMEGFSNGESYYLPDFFLPDVYLRGQTKGVFVEIKPGGWDDTKSLSWFDKPLVVFCGMPENNTWNYVNIDGGFQIYPCFDTNMMLWRCGSCGKVKIEFLEGNYNTCFNGCNGNANIDELTRKAILTTKHNFKY